ncbi:MAG: diguanylate cyclase, partial [Azoarcus sp.]|nr:diguanylate cyclase [Azoarcus sp.]
GIPLTDNGKPTPNLGFIPVIYRHSPADAAQEELVATLNLEYLLKQIASVIETQGIRVALLRADGLRLLDTSPADAGLLMIEREIGEHWHNGDISGVQEKQAVDNRQWIVAHRLYPQLLIGVVWAADRDHLLEGINRSIRRNNLTVILLMVVGMVCTLFGYIFFRHASRHERERHFRTEQQRRLLENTLNACANAIIITRPDGIIEWANPAYTTLTGYTIAEAMGRSPGDLERSGIQDRVFYAHMWQTIRDGRVWHGELVNRRKDGSLYDALLTIAPSLDNNGVIQHFIATKTDFTEHKAARAELEIAHSHLNAVVENFPGALVMEDTQGRIVLLNQYLFELMGLPGTNDYVLGKPIQPLMLFSSRAVESNQVFMDRVDALRAALRPVYGEELNFKDGRWIERDFIPIHLHNNLIGFLYIYRDISQRKRHARELWQLATSDPLTGIANRRAFFEDIERERARLARYPGEAAVLMIDIDHFKQINDTYGHAAGDAMLGHVVRQMRKLLRESDILARLGGEEFAILLPQANLEGALGLAERIRKVLEDNPLNYNDIPIHVTTSVGVTIMTASDLNTDQTMSRADHALYEAKRNGRNRVEAG